MYEQQRLSVSAELGGSRLDLSRHQIFYREPDAYSVRVHWMKGASFGVQPKAKLGSNVSN